MPSSGRGEELHGSYVQIRLHLVHLGIVRNLLSKCLSAASGGKNSLVSHSVVIFCPGGTGYKNTSMFVSHDLLLWVALHGLNSCFVLQCNQKMQPSVDVNVFDLQVELQALQSLEQHRS